MDALRKAEEEKRKTAERQQQEVLAPGADSAPRALREDLPGENLTLEPLAEQTAATPQSTHPPAEPIDLELVPAEIERDDATDVTDIWAPQHETPVEDYSEALPSASLEQENLQLTEAESKLEQILGPMDLESTLPSKRELESALKDYFEISRHGAKEPLPAELAASTELPVQVQDEGATEATAQAWYGDGTAPTHEQIKSITPPPLRVSADPAATHVTAHTIFSSTQATYASRIKRYSLFSSLVILALVGTAVLYYVLLPPIQVTPAPSVAIETPPAVPGPVRETQPLVPPLQAAAPVSTQPSEAALAQSEAVSSTVEGSIAPPQSVTVSPGTDDQPFPETTRVAGTETLTETTARPEPTLEDAAPVAPYSQPIAVPTSAIKITRGRATRSWNVDLTQAYRAYRIGDYAAARRGYEAALRVQPDQRDALLGLAAIESRYGRIERAHRIYAQVLKRNPRDPIASAALFNLHNLDGRYAAESQIKLLLDQYPNSPGLHFSLGNFYARGSHWPEAQQAYFSAFSADKDNPEYAYNLAVSLDQLGKANVASQYYQKALILSDERAPSFNLGEVRARIRALSGHDRSP